MSDLLALYGSLRRGQPPYEAMGLDHMLRFTGPCTMKGTLHDFGEWPGLVPGEGLVTGELYQVLSQRTLAQLDEYEACDVARPDCGLFVRRLVPLVQPDGTSAHVYFYNGATDGAPAVPGGDWVTYLRSRD